MDFAYENNFFDCDVLGSTTTLTCENGLYSTLFLAQQIPAGSSSSNLSYQNPFEENTSAYYNHYQADRTDSNPPPIPASVVSEASVTICSVEVEDEPPKAKRLNVKAQFGKVLGYKPRSGENNHGKSVAVRTSSTHASFVPEELNGSACASSAAPATLTTVGERTVSQSKTQLDDLMDACRHMRGIPKNARNEMSNSLLAFGLFAKPPAQRQEIIQQAKSVFLHRVKYFFTENPEARGQADRERILAAEADELEKMLMMDTHPTIIRPITPLLSFPEPAPTIARTQPELPTPVLLKKKNARLSQTHVTARHKLHCLLVKSNHESHSMEEIQSANTDDLDVLSTVTPSPNFDDYQNVKEGQQNIEKEQVGTVAPEEMRVDANELPIGTTCTTEDILPNLDLPSTSCVGISKTPELQEPTLIRLDIVASPLSYNGNSLGLDSSATSGPENSSRTGRSPSKDADKAVSQDSSRASSVCSTQSICSFEYPVPTERTNSSRMNKPKAKERRHPCSPSMNPSSDGSLEGVSDDRTSIKQTVRKGARNRARAPLLSSDSDWSAEHQLPRTQFKSPPKTLRSSKKISPAEEIPEHEQCRRSKRLANAANDTRIGDAKRVRDGDGASSEDEGVGSNNSYFTPAKKRSKTVADMDHRCEQSSGPPKRDRCTSAATVRGNTMKIEMARKSITAPTTAKREMARKSAMATKTSGA